MAALEEMVRCVGAPEGDEVDGRPRLTRGVVVRHLMLPGALEDSKRVVRTIWERFGNGVLLSLMNQYTPVIAQAAAAGDSRCSPMRRKLGMRGRNASFSAAPNWADAYLMANTRSCWTMPIR